MTLQAGKKVGFVNFNKLAGHVVDKCPELLPGSWWKELIPWFSPKRLDTV